MVAWYVSGLNKTIPVVILEIVTGNIDPQVNAIGSLVFLTSITTMLTMVPLLVLGDGVLQTFGLIFALGTAVGTLSSIYIVGVHAGDIVMGDTQTLSA